MNAGEAHNRDTIRHLYVHFPFCARICPYCAFYKTRGSSTDVANFCAAVVHEAETVAKKFPLRLETIFFGGGTPTVLGTANLRALLERFHRIFDLSHMREWTVEANPGSVSLNKADTLRASGVDRISLGVQSWDDELLTVLGREHNAAQAAESFRAFRAAGFTNLGMDLMFAIPGQSHQQWQHSIEETLSLGPEHISTYCLTLEEDTEFLRRFQRGEFKFEEENEARFFEVAMSTLISAGYQHYEISNFARPGYESQHNRAYWSGEDYIGIGPSAFSTRGLERWQNVADHREYASRVLAGASPTTSTETLSAQTKRTEHIALKLRTSDGADLETVDPGRAHDLISAGLLRESGGTLVLTRAGKLVADSVAEELL